ncbi:inositol 1,4,5-trisphosphate receptor-interacting protein-like 1 [Myiozetetes cayanensis]|uniref:inositol 1,4,5-trisphosphate receptor-interacting protein-like 1 n=1 Tax=Myiozetetes cayanensis TaxID=478635 RepID=UPI0021604D96|nr:inositol 1,4,5-trisphosphate receptor-interacting protein-like 1 [Myiozetetes cayanensis]
MASKTFLFVLLQTLIQYPQLVGDGLDEATRLRVELRAELLNREMTRLLQELEQSSLERTLRAWGALLWAALQQEKFWALVVVLGLLLALWFMRRRRSRQPDNNGEEEEVEDREDHEDFAPEVEEEATVENAMRWLLVQLIPWPVQDLKRGCEVTRVLIDNFTFVFGHILSNSFHPVPQSALGVGSAFEGWSTREKDVVYSVLVPLTPPPGHAFHLEMDTSGQLPGRNFRVRVEPVCTCTREQQDENVLCFLHHPEEEQRRNEEPSLLHTLCSGSYLDVDKTARWFYQLVRAAWVALPQAHTWHLVLLPSSRSCKFKVSRGRESLMVEVLFGVQEGNSDIYVSSQPTEALFTPSTMWPETYAVAEMKFFRHIARQAPPDSWHLKCLQLLAHALLGIGFSTYTLKTIVMHLLNTIPVSRWGRRQFLRRLGDALEYLHGSLEEKRLDHFVLGNRTLPGEIILPPDVKAAEPLNLFHRLAQDPDAHTQAMREYHELGDRIERIVLYGH